MARGAIKIAALVGLAKQAREYARKNPDKVSSSIGKVEDAVGRRVGPKYSAHVGKGGKAVRSGLGIPSPTPAPGVTPTVNDGTVSPPSVPPTV